MQKIELTIAPSYVPSWGIVEAIRELFQNALDQQKQNPTNEMSWEYDQATQRLRICNKYSVLTASSLLLGQTTKADDETTIGQFGEGYKIATLALLRSGKNITFYNYGAKEIWRPRFVNSRRFNTQVLTFFIDKKAFWEKVPSNDLVIEIEGITEEEYEQRIVPSNLHLRDDYAVVATSEYGDVISLPGKVFVNGLFVCDFKPYKYGYNFKPEQLKLDRDRKMVSDFDLRWLASKIWGSLSLRYTDKAIALVIEGAADVAYIDSSSYSNTTALREACYDAFYDTYGEYAIPVAEQSELDTVPSGYKGIMVPETYNRLIRSSRQFITSAPPMQSEAEKLLEQLNNWFNTVSSKLSDDETSEFVSIIDKLTKEV